MFHHFRHKKTIFNEFKRTELLDIPSKHTSVIEFFLSVFYFFPYIFINSVELKFSSSISVIILYQQRTLKDRYKYISS